MVDLASEKCVACRKGEPALTDAEINDLMPFLRQWQIREVDGMKRLEKVYKFRNFTEALDFTNRVGAIAEEEDHHPQIITEWGKVTLQWWTHLIGGLHKNDFIMAAKVDDVYGSPNPTKE